MCDMEQMIVQFPTCPCCTPVPADQGKGSPPESGVLVMTPPMIADGELLEVGRSTGWGLGGHRLASGWGVPTERRRAGLIWYLFASLPMALGFCPGHWGWLPVSFFHCHQPLFGARLPSFLCGMSSFPHSLSPLVPEGRRAVLTSKPPIRWAHAGIGKGFLHPILFFHEIPTERIKSITIC